jgi:hypothetical protein
MAFKLLRVNYLTLILILNLNPNPTRPQSDVFKATASGLVNDVFEG